MNRLIGAVAITFLLPVGAIAQNCTQHTTKLRVDHKNYQELQRFVNEGHQPWRLDSQAVAGWKALEVDHVPGHPSAYLVDVKLVSEKGRIEIYEYKSVHDPYTVYRIALQHPKWLDSLAKKPQRMIWVPVEVTTTTCKSNPLK